MEPIFENQYMRDKETAKEVAAGIYFKRPMAILILVLCGICFAVNLFNLLMGFDAFIYGLIFPLVYAVFWIYSYLMFKNSLIKRDAETFKGDVVITTGVYEDHITLNASNGSVVELEYGKIKKISLTKNYILVLSKARLMYILKKDSFTKGSLPEFTEFIKSKGLKIK